MGLALRPSERFSSADPQHADGSFDLRAAEEFSREVDRFLYEFLHPDTRSEFTREDVIAWIDAMCVVANRIIGLKSGLTPGVVDYSIAAISGAGAAYSGWDLLVQATVAVLDPTSVGAFIFTTSATVYGINRMTRTVKRKKRSLQILKSRFLKLAARLNECL